jgi:hypothetical protein
MTKQMKRSEASKETPITIQLTGFPSIEQAKKFLCAIVRPDLQDCFANANMTLEEEVFTVSQIICCNGDKSEFGVCSDVPLSELCIRLGSGCPTIHLGE